ncbi:MAG: mannose-1-phosphate guanyltransferase, partial [Planctomycetaceae bacterium]|nr:mannose-1-phosphate guanyltransferase [Planctomycetaceae bacterium]
AAMCLLQEDPDAVMLVMPADHAISPVEQFHDAVRRATQQIESAPHSLVLFGVTPTYPATGYGYIERDQSLGDPTQRAFKVREFHEKPPRERAEQFLAGGRHYWNCGIFVWKASRILELIRQHQPEIGNLLNEIDADLGTDREEDALKQIFPRMPSISIDHAVLEKAQDVVVLEAPFAWDDVGSWQAVARLKGTDGN